MTKQASIGVAVITHQAKRHLIHCLPPLLSSPLKPAVLVVNSSSFDGTVEEAERLGAETLVIPRSAFNHGSTRELARKRLATDIVVMVTPDAYPTHASMLENLVDPLVSGKASVSYARQIPHDGADLFEAFPRSFNYPSKSHIRSLKDAQEYGAYLSFCSDSCAAYSNTALDEIGGFHPVLALEDCLATAKLLRKGHKIAYCANAVVQHSHRYGLWQEFQRHFDIGYVRKKHRTLIDFGSNDLKRGQDYLKALIRSCSPHPQRIPYGLLHCITKWLGYKLGGLCTSAPTSVKRAFSAQDFFWRSDDFLSGRAT